MTVKNVIMDEQGVARTLTRLAHEILERNRGASNLAIVGIRSRGDSLARRLAELIDRIETTSVPIGVLDISFYRDDLRRRLKLPEVRSTDIPFPIDDRDVILVDDVLFTGRTIRAALDALMDIGRPASVQLAVLVDRGRRELPIQPDFAGRIIPTSPGEVVRVHAKEIDGEDAVLLVEE
ncbi:MAG: bifunctional pyr operon transcriptional regulator/uracil phosphoribosyltransferase PyrR [Ignavibacteriales bacterium CG07_land_8_20_14_0_80_59_12]|nr:MAG: bifunctional pyr operon transcriptional regulator/uracil phosphoribosyltransferase PyrR [Ignavibacteriales bacterium CG07_land_8_20_14_0_80_59_12]